jgi:hypothetical protein
MLEEGLFGGVGGEVQGAAVGAAGLVGLAKGAEELRAIQNDSLVIDRSACMFDYP